MRTNLRARLDEIWASLADAPADWIPKSLYELPVARVRNIAWQHLEDLTLSEIEEHALLKAQKIHGDRTMLEDYPEAPTAVLGTDGRYHLMEESRVLCGETTRRGRVQHKRDYSAYFYKGRYKARATARIPGECSVCRAWVSDLESFEAEHRHEWIRREHTWTFRLTGEIADPHSVHTWLRCPDGRWPSYVSPDSPRGRVVRKLIEAHGSDCHLCGRRPGIFLDHDHLTSEARGMLCIGCNAKVEVCTHLRGCAIAEYLNHPPAEGMCLRYPKYKKSASDRRKELLVGMPMSTLPENVRDWRWEHLLAD